MEDMNKNSRTHYPHTHTQTRAVASGEGGGGGGGRNGGQLPPPSSRKSSCSHRSQLFKTCFRDRKPHPKATPYFLSHTLKLRPFYIISLVSCGFLRKPRRTPSCALHFALAFRVSFCIHFALAFCVSRFALRLYFAFCISLCALRFSW